MELFKSTNFDFLGKKWPFIGASLALTVAGLSSIAMKGGIKYGIDFTGGSQMSVKFAGAPPEGRIRSALGAKFGDLTVQRLSDASSTNEVIIGTGLKDEKELEQGRKTMIDTLTATFGQPQSGKLEFNNAGEVTLLNRLRDPLQRGGAQLAEPQLKDLVRAILAFRNNPPQSGLITSFDQLSTVPGVSANIINALKQECYLAPFAVRSVTVVGPKVANDLRKQAVQATLLALAGMLAYIAFRFEWIYGVAAVVAVFHDTIITIGFFSLFNKEIDLTVIAALLTLVGYSMNDTIVIFDRIRENLKILRREPLESLMNKSVNQTLSRTILTSGLTFLTVIALFLFGGPVLNPFSFALVVGILIGTYSSVFVASPIVLFWQNYTEGRKRGGRIPPAPPVKPAVRQEGRPLAKKAK
ncbi:MAG: protein translocase subunit SecF [Acidobacteria bacterium]|nr:protein translocase subunit SecF [Acidobacteriota bacterium]MBI3472160.1 protein translocase subunit SecF [Candidatus Solibacter usitatus]